MAGRAAFLMVISTAAFSPAASAHDEADWLHGFLDGAVAFFTALEFLLPVLIVALLARHQGLRPVIIQAVALGIGLLVALLGLPVQGDPAAMGLYARVYLVALGLLVLFNLRLRTGLVLLLVLAAGTLTGVEAGISLIGDPPTGFVSAVGFVSSAICFYLPAALIASHYPHGWQRIAMRVVASWVAAIAVIDIAFMIARSD